MITGDGVNAGIFSSCIVFISLDGIEILGCQWCWYFCLGCCEWWKRW